MFFYKDGADNTYRLDSKNQENILPVGCIEITEGEAGEIRQSRIVVQSFAALKAIETQAYIELREKMCARVAGIAARMARGGDAVSAASCDAVVVALLDVLNHPTVTGATDIAAFRLAIKTRYAASVANATTAAKAEFKLYDK